MTCWEGALYFENGDCDVGVYDSELRMTGSPSGLSLGVVERLQETCLGMGQAWARERMIMCWPSQTRPVEIWKESEFVRVGVGVRFNKERKAAVKLENGQGKARALVGEDSEASCEVPTTLSSQRLS